MKVRYLGKTEFLVLTNNKVYDVQSVEKGWYQNCRRFWRGLSISTKIL